MTDYLTTAEAAAYCRFKSVFGLHSAHRAGKVFPVGKRGGGRGTKMWRREDLDAFLRGGSDGVGDEVRVRGSEQVSPPGDLPPEERGLSGPGPRDDPKTGQRPAVVRALHHATIDQAQRVLDELKADKSAEVRGRKPQRQRFDAFAVSRFEAKVLAGDIRSAKGKLARMIASGYESKRESETGLKAESDAFPRHDGRDAARPAPRRLVTSSCTGSVTVRDAKSDRSARSHMCLH